LLLLLLLVLLVVVVVIRGALKSYHADVILMPL